MVSELIELCGFFAAAQGRHESLVLATVIHTRGSTYQKAGARFLIARDGTTSGVSSGGCVEADLIERAHRVADSGASERVVYDTTGPEDIIWGLGLGCEGVTEVWLDVISHRNGYEPILYMQGCLQRRRSGGIATVVGGQTLGGELGRHGYAGVPGANALCEWLGRQSMERPQLRTLAYDGRALEVFAAPVTMPPALLICGSGPDAIPIARLAQSLGWRVTLVDHRAAHADAARFPPPAEVICAPCDELGSRLELSAFDAAVIMSHNFEADLAYLRQIAVAPIRYVGLLGPPSRRVRLAAEVGESAARMGDRLFGPAGLDIGARGAQSIAVSIIAQIHQVLSGRGRADGAD